MPEIATYASTSSPSWPTFSGRSMCKVVSDMCLLDHCHRSPTGFTLGDQAALALFMNRGLMVRKQGEPGEHFFVVGQMYYVSILVPAVEVLVDGNNGLKGFSIAEISKANLVFQVVLDLDDWEATPIEWATPLILSHRLGRAPCFKGVVALPTGPAENLLKAAARHCFWSVTGGALDLALDHLGMRTPPKSFDKVVALLQKLLGPLSDEELLKLLRKRMNLSDDKLKELLSFEGVAQELGKQDAQMGKAGIRKSSSSPHACFGSRPSWPGPLDLGGRGGASGHASFDLIPAPKRCVGIVFGGLGLCRGGPNRQGSASNYAAREAALATASSLPGPYISNLAVLGLRHLVCQGARSPFLVVGRFGRPAGCLILPGVCGKSQGGQSTGASHPGCCKVAARLREHLGSFGEGVAASGRVRSA